MYIYVQLKYVYICATCLLYIHIKKHVYICATKICICMCNLPFIYTCEKYVYTCATEICVYMCNLPFMYTHKKTCIYMCNSKMCIYVHYVYT